MPDYDVGVVGLAVPPASAPVATYYPAVSVKNYGIHPATVTGTLRIYDKAAGSLLATHALASTAPIAPGATANVPSPTTWAPTQADVNRQFLFIADVTTPGGQDDQNNLLDPVTVTVVAGPGPQPTQHIAVRVRFADGQFLIIGRTDEDVPVAYVDRPFYPED